MQCGRRSTRCWARRRRGSRLPLTGTAAPFFGWSEGGRCAFVVGRCQDSDAGLAFQKPEMEEHVGNEGHEGDALRYLCAEPEGLDNGLNGLKRIRTDLFRLEFNLTRKQPHCVGWPPEEPSVLMRFHPTQSVVRAFAFAFAFALPLFLAFALLVLFLHALVSFMSFLFPAFRKLELRAES